MKKFPVGYIYLRFHQSYRLKDRVVIKLGGTSNPVQRDPTYKTGEPDKGNYLKIFEVSDWETVENLLQDEFKEYHYDGSGGSEFYEFHIIHKIEDTLTKLGFEYKEVDICEINRKSRTLELRDRFIKKLKKNASVKKYRRKLEELKRQRDKNLTKRCLHERTVNIIQQIEMRDYQVEEKIMNWYDIHDKGILNWICGLGKTITSLNVSKKYVNNHLLIGLNSLGLFDQWIKVILKFYDLPILCICSSNIDGHTTTTNIDVIKDWLNKNPKGIVITSYRSAYKLKDLGISFDFGIFDECHHLCSVKDYDENDEDDERDLGERQGKNTDILSLTMKKSLGLTATMKRMDSNERINYNDNFNEDIFGKIIDEKSVLWGIEKGYLCDYELACPLLKYELLEEMIENSSLRGIDKDDYYLFLAAYMSIESILNGDRKKMLIFVNKIIEIQKVYAYITHLLEENDKFTMDDVFKVDQDTTDTSKIIKEFNDLEYGIMINVYKIGEGIDIPSLDSVLIACDMYSKIRIVQSLLRCCRIHGAKTKARFIIPMIYDEDSNFNSDDDLIKIKTYATVKEVIEQLSHSDVNIIDKVKIGKVTQSKKGAKKTYEINEDIPDLTNQFRMRIIKRFNIGKRMQIETMKKYIKLLGGRRDDKKGYLQDYRDTKQGKMGLPDLDFLNRYLENNDYTILDLYSVDVSDYPVWSEFEKKFKSRVTYEEYRVFNDIKFPKVNDLGDIYPNYNRGFWDDSLCDE